MRSWMGGLHQTWQSKGYGRIVPFCTDWASAQVVALGPSVAELAIGSAALTQDINLNAMECGNLYEALPITYYVYVRGGALCAPFDYFRKYNNLRFVSNFSHIFLPFCYMLGMSILLLLGQWTRNIENIFINKKL